MLSSDNNNNNDNNIGNIDISNSSIGNDSVSGSNDDYSIHERIEKIYKDTDVDRKAEIRDRIKYGDSFTKIALSIAFWGFWIFWIIVVLL